MEMLWAYRRIFSIQHSSCVGLFGPYMVVVTLAPQLRDGPYKTESFIGACQALAEYAENFPVAKYILAMLKALEMEHDFGFPEGARTILQGSNLRPEELKDIAMEMQIPITARHRGRTGGSGSPVAVTSETVGELLARWTGPSSEEPR